MYLLPLTENKQSGIFKTKKSTAKNPEQLYKWEISMVIKKSKAKMQKCILTTKETYQEAPNVYISGQFQNRK